MPQAKTKCIGERAHRDTAPDSEDVIGSIHHWIVHLCAACGPKQEGFGNPNAGLKRAHLAQPVPKFPQRPSDQRVCFVVPIQHRVHRMTEETAKPRRLKEDAEGIQIRIPYFPKPQLQLQ